jgi:hypothetical protein
VSPTWEAFLRFFVDNKLIVFVLVAGIMAGGVYVSPFDWELGEMPRDRVPVDAIPDIGENQQIVFTEWQGRSPRDDPRRPDGEELLDVRLLDDLRDLRRRRGVLLVTFARS